MRTTVRVHDLRHTFACRLRAAGLSAEDRSALLGHAPHAMSGHCASADGGRLLGLANRVLNREEHVHRAARRERLAVPPPLYTTHPTLVNSTGKEKRVGALRC